MDSRFVLTDLPSDKGADGLVTSDTRRCRGCAGCITVNMGTCAIDDGFTPLVDKVFSHKVLEVRTGITDSQFSMPMRKAMERLGNILQSYTDAGGNVPLDSDSVELERIEVKVRGSRDSDFERYAISLMKMGPVESVTFDYAGCVEPGS